MGMDRQFYTAKSALWRRHYQLFRSLKRTEKQVEICILCYFFLWNILGQSKLPFKTFPFASPGLPSKTLQFPHPMGRFSHVFSSNSGLWASLRDWQRCWHFLQCISCLRKHRKLFSLYSPNSPSSPHKIASVRTSGASYQNLWVCQSGPVARICATV